MTERLRIDTSLGSIAVFDSGRGKPIFLWPSLFTDHRLYDAMVAGLVPHGWRTLAIDGPGFGQSDPPDGLVQPETYAEAVVAMAGTLGIDRFSFAGCSWGGMVGAHLGLRDASRLNALVLMNTPLLPSRGGHLFEYWGARLAVSSSKLAEGTAREMLGQRALADPDKLAMFTEPFASFERGPAARTVDVTLRHFAGLEDVLAASRAPTTIMMGAEDTLYPTADLMPIAERAPAAKIVIVPDCGHIIPIESPEAAVAAILEADRQPEREQGSPPQPSVGSGA